MSSLRVIDAGEVSALRSQALWHGLASAMTDDSPVTLSFCRSLRPYVGIGYHRSLDELDIEHCRRQRLPVIRRRIGGGPVYVDDQQLLFQLTMPAARAPARVDLLYRRFLGPAVAAFRTFGLDAELRGVNDIAVADRKLSGTGAGRIGNGVLVVGNVISSFPHRRMVETLALSRGRAFDECLRLMRRHVSSLSDEGVSEVTLQDAKKRLIESYASALAMAPASAVPASEEEAQIRRWERRLSSPEWTVGPQTTRRRGRLIKISSDAWMWSIREEDITLEVSIACGRIERIELQGAALNGSGEEIRDRLAGHQTQQHLVAKSLERFGREGVRVAQLLAPGLSIS